MTSRTMDKFVLRLPDGMRDRLAELAATNARSMNSEMILRLQHSMEGELVQAVVESTEDYWVPMVGMAVECPHGLAVIGKMFVRDQQLFATVQGHLGVCGDFPVRSLSPLRQRVRNTLDVAPLD